MERGKGSVSKRFIFFAVFSFGAAAPFIVKLSEPSASVVPLTYTQTTWRLGADGIDVANTDGDDEIRTVIAVRGDGSSARVTSLPNAAGGRSEIRYIVDYQKGTRIVLEESTKSMMSFPLTFEQLQSNTRSGPRSCEGVEVESTTLGFAMVRRTVDQGQRRYVNFHAPDLGCLPISMRVFQLLDDSDNSYRLVQEDRAESIVLGEPNESLFIVEGDYIERSPASLVMEMGGDEQRENPDRIFADPFVRQAEESYYRSRGQSLPTALKEETNTPESN